MGAVQEMVLNKLPVVAPSVSRGVPRRLRASGGQSGGGRRPERNEGCLAIDRNDGVGGFNIIVTMQQEPGRKLNVS